MTRLTPGDILYSTHSPRDVYEVLSVSKTHFRIKGIVGEHVGMIRRVSWECIDSFRLDNAPRGHSLTEKN